MISCLICNARGSITDHHIHPRSYKESYPGGIGKISEPANILHVCRPCHDCIHDKRELYIILRDTKQKLRRPLKARKFTSEEFEKQSVKDRAKLLEGYTNLLTTLEDPHKRQLIEDYRRILRTVERMHLRVLGKE